MNKCLQIVKKLLDIGDTDILIYKELLNLGEAKVSEIARIVKKDRTTVQRSLNKLIRKGLCMKRKICLDGGGYCYVYSYKDPAEVKALLEKCIEEWYIEIKKLKI